MSIGRFECYLYGKLIAILIGGHIQFLFNKFIEDKEDFELSEWKAYKVLKKIGPISMIHATDGV